MQDGALVIAAGMVTMVVVLELEKLPMRCLGRTFGSFRPDHRTAAPPSAALREGGGGQEQYQVLSTR